MHLIKRTLGWVLTYRICYKQDLLLYRKCVLNKNRGDTCRYNATGQLVDISSGTRFNNSVELFPMDVAL